MLLRPTLILLTLVFLAGCGSSQYEEKFETSLDTLRNEAPFSSLWPQPISVPLSVEGENIIVKVRIPRVFDTKTEEAYVLDQNTPSPRNPEVAVTADRLWPTFLRMGTHLRTYEVTLNFKNVAGAKCTIFYPLFSRSDAEEQRSGRPWCLEQKNCRETQASV